MLTPGNVLITTIDAVPKFQFAVKPKFRKKIRIRVHSQAEHYCNLEKTSTALNILTPELSTTRFSKYKDSAFSLTPPNRMAHNFFWRTLSLTNQITDENRLIRKKLHEYDQFNKAK